MQRNPRPPHTALLRQGPSSTIISNEHNDHKPEATSSLSREAAYPYLEFPTQTQTMTSMFPGENLENFPCGDTLPRFSDDVCRELQTFSGQLRPHVTGGEVLSYGGIAILHPLFPLTLGCTTAVVSTHTIFVVVHVTLPR
ncbi:uncharacterized protein LOC125468640 isoform X1 [Pyrus x bretschneideri]|uniref:uncharacterized protein LOC125468640 isoform X1 n=1 Tax=Pyrus x bretschneideri TaxID=225117 RepID=UPI00202DB6D0|nr:uncharacterized protein LOC125468640 isoform X1 [Pyrus x bretschneideri]